MRDLTLLPLDKIRTDGGTQMREGLDQEVAERYAEVLENGGTLPPGVVYYDGTDYWAADVFHRLEAHRLAGRACIEVAVVPGTLREAQLFACGVNADHGKPRNRKEARRAVRKLLLDEEWGQWTNAEIGRRCRVDPKTVQAVRAELEEVRVPGNAGDGRPKRKASRGGTTYEMKVPCGARPPVPGEREARAALRPPAWLDFARNAAECLEEARQHLVQVPQEAGGRATAAVEVAAREVQAVIGGGP